MANGNGEDYQRTFQINDSHNPVKQKTKEFSANLAMKLIPTAVQDCESKSDHH